MVLHWIEWCCWCHLPSRTLHLTLIINVISSQALIDADETIIGIACGDNQTVVVSTSGSVWGWGSYTDKEGKKFFNPSKNGESS